MLNNGHASGMGTEGPGGPSYYPGNSYLGPPPSSMGHHSGGICSQMTVNQNTCPPNTRCCYGCGGPIFSQYLLQALEKYWHHTCLKCSACGVTLADVGASCFTRDGMILCRHDYIKIFGNGGVCGGCGQGIPPSEFVMRAGVSPPGSSPNLVFHVKCFMCSKCGSRLCPGDRYSVLNGALFCEQDAVACMKLMKNGIGSPNANVATTNGPAPARKGKVGRPRRSS